MPTQTLSTPLRERQQIAIESIFVFAAFVVDPALRDESEWVWKDVGVLMNEYAGHADWCAGWDVGLGFSSLDLKWRGESGEIRCRRELTPYDSLRPSEITAVCL